VDLLLAESPAGFSFHDSFIFDRTLEVYSKLQLKAGGKRGSRQRRRTADGRSGE
jgi:hypothetical protein